MDGLLQQHFLKGKTKTNSGCFDHSTTNVKLNPPLLVLYTFLMYNFGREKTKDYIYAKLQILLPLISHRSHSDCNL